MAYPILQAKSHLTHYRTATVNSRKVFLSRGRRPKLSHNCPIAWTSDQQPDVSRADSRARRPVST